jgi:hypothetical protein
MFTPAKHARAHPRPSPKVSGKVALVGKASRESDFGKREVGLAEHLFSVIETPA